MVMVDMHAHLQALTQPQMEEELTLRSQHQLITCFSVGTPQEWQQMKALQKRPEVKLSFGLHPWYADQYTIEECMDALQQCDFIGEIGMDSVWCTVSPQVQRRQLERQLQLAADWKKPVILHTKGQEEQICDILKGFPEKVCIHWYSGPEKTLEPYMQQDCYFTLGPDTAALCRQDSHMNRRMVAEIAADRLFVETDGIAAVAWAMGKEQLELAQIPAILEENLAYAANIKGLTPEAMAAQMQQNLKEFLMQA